MHVSAVIHGGRSHKSALLRSVMVTAVAQLVVAQLWMYVHTDHGSQCVMRGTTWMVSVSMAVAVSVTAVPNPIGVA